MSKKRKISKQGLENIRKAAKKMWAKRRAVRRVALDESLADIHGASPVAANERQVGGNHYKGCKIEPWDFATANGLDFMQGSVIRYVVRYKDKNGIEDLEKAKHYIEKMIETAIGAK